MDLSWGLLTRVFRLKTYGDSKVPRKMCRNNVVIYLPCRRKVRGREGRRSRERELEREGKILLFSFK